MQKLFIALALPALLLTLNLQLSTAFAQGTVFTYQGRLLDGGAPANGTNYSMVFYLYDAPTNGNLLGNEGIVSVTVSNGVFTVPLDFGNQFDGQPRWLQASVEKTGPGGDSGFTLLLPRQQIMPTPYAMFANSASNAVNAATATTASSATIASSATTATTATTANNFSGSLAGDVTGTQSATAVAKVGGVTAANVAGGANAANAATSATTANAIVKRDASGNFSAGTITAGAFSGNGANVTNVNAATLGGLASGSFWQTGGNGGTTPGANFIGTTDNEPLEFRVNNQRALRLEPATNSSDQSINVLGGSSYNFVTAGVVGVTIAGGGSTNVQFGGASPNSATADYATVGGGDGNTATGGAATVGGGTGNTAGKQNSTVGGGDANSASGDTATIAGGYDNAASSLWATVAGGDRNTASSQASVVGGGSSNQATTNNATVPGGANNIAGGQYSFAAGQQVQALNDGSFVWADDSSSTAFATTSSNQFLIRAAGGVGIGTATPDRPLSILGNGVNGEWVSFKNTSGVTKWHLNNKDGGLNFAQTGVADERLFLSTNGNVYVNGIAVTSDRNAKENFQTVNPQTVLAKVAALPITEWNYKTADAGQKHLGPMAQDFHAAFGLDGSDDKHISMINEGGVALAAIQGLNEKLEVGSEKAEGGIQKAEKQIEELKTENATLKQQNELLAQRLNALALAVKSLDEKK